MINRRRPDGPAAASTTEKGIGQMSNDKMDATGHGGDLPRRDPMDALDVAAKWGRYRDPQTDAPVGAPPWGSLHQDIGHEPRRTRTIAVPLAVTAILTGLVAMAIFVWVNNLLPVGVPVLGKDTGIAACEAISAGSGPIGSQKTGDEKMTPEQYQKLRAVFDDSRYPEIGEPGVRVIDLAWQIQGMGEDAGLALLPMIGPLTESYGALTGGCAKHGITIPSLGSR